MKTVIDRCENIIEAQNVIKELLNFGFNRSDITLVKYAADEVAINKGKAVGGTVDRDVTVTGFVEALKNMGVTEEKAYQYDKEVRRGEILVLVNTSSDMAERVAEIMRSHSHTVGEGKVPAQFAGEKMRNDTYHSDNVCIYDYSKNDPDEKRPYTEESSFVSPYRADIEKPAVDITDINQPHVQTLKPVLEKTWDREKSSEKRFYSSKMTDYSSVPDDLLKLENMYDFEVADGEPDPRGWDLLGKDNEKIGTIKNLLASPSTQMAYFAIVDCSDWLENKFFAVPLSNISFNTDEEKAYSPYIKEQFRNAPLYKEDDRDYISHYRYWFESHEKESTKTAGI
jgi:hypothetical protein